MSSQQADNKARGAFFAQFPIFIFSFRWLLLAVLVGSLAGTASAIFLVSLDALTDYREANTNIIYALPLAGLLIGLMYHYLGDSVVRGNNLLLDEVHQPVQRIPFRMAPLVLLGTLITHLFGGSAGREGTAVQMGGALADQLSKPFRLQAHDRRIILLMGISAGFASVFGTPLAGAVFALEVIRSGRLRYEAILPVFLSAAMADYACTAWGVGHTHYHISEVPAFSMPAMAYCLLAGISFGLVARLFSGSTHFFSQLFKKHIQYPPLRPVIGGLVLALIFALIQDTRYFGLGIPAIVEAFEQPVPAYDFIFKLLFTAFTLGAAFKGGEVTPLFFIGATLGNALFWILPLPMSLLAGMGFVAVFAGATNTPLACTLMGIELFGAESGLYIGIACVTAYMFSGHSGIYGAQKVGSAKHPNKKSHENKSLEDLHAHK
ncbi:MAG: voltage-gated chloride channel family protein [Bacteroidia bacterium]